MVDHLVFGDEDTCFLIYDNLGQNLSIACICITCDTFQIYQLFAALTNWSDVDIIYRKHA